jgi:hypothetical protein
MDKPAFPNHETDRDIIKLSMVSTAVHSAITELAQDKMTLPDKAFIGIIAFGARAALVPDQAGKPFIISVSEIQAQFGDSLGDYLYRCFENDKPGIDRRYTDITAALQLARQIYDAAIAGDLSQFGASKEVKIMEHSDVVTFDKRQISVPNVRVMLYSDGEHNPDPEKSVVLTNPFASLDPSPLMTAFIGDEKASEETSHGADQLLELANICPEHREKGYFLINSPGRRAVLRRLFRMASGASGFCPQCLMGVIRGREEHKTRALKVVNEKSITYEQ